jgi:hypothetical protein
VVGIEDEARVVVALDSHQGWDFTWIREERLVHGLWCADHQRRLTASPRDLEALAAGLHQAVVSDIRVFDEPIFRVRRTRGRELLGVWAPLTDGDRLNLLATDRGEVVHGLSLPSRCLGELRDGLVSVARELIATKRGS